MITEQWTALLKPIRRATPTEMQLAPWIHLDDKAGAAECGYCNGMNKDWCYNCQKPICTKHAIPMVFLVSPMIRVVFNVCYECAQMVGAPEDN